MSLRQSGIFTPLYEIYFAARQRNPVDEVQKYTSTQIQFLSGKDAWSFRSESKMERSTWMKISDNPTLTENY